MIRRLFTFAFLFIVTAMIFQCAQSALSSGGGTDLPNTKTVVGILVSQDGKPSPNTKVMLVSSKYNVVADSSLSIMEDTTDSNGVYRFFPADSGEYTLTAVQLEKKTRAIICGIHVEKDTVRVITAMLLKPGKIKVAIPDSANTSTGYFYIPGTTISVMLQGCIGSAILDSVPAGIIPSVNYGDVKHRIVSVVRYSITVSPEVLTNVLNPNWTYAKTIFLNTTSTGAAISGNVIGFPVLIRLSSLNFNFSQARTNGDDMRFAKSNGTPLFYEIEAWDSSKAAAAIWVRVDTIFGNNSNQNVVMYWGSAASSMSNGAKVFDTANGFQGVWHLSSPTGFPVVDATVNGYNGVPQGSAIPGSVQGIIGNANIFNGADFIEMQGTASSTLNFPQHGTYSVSAWVNIDSLIGDYQMIASKGDKQYNLQFKGTSKNWQFTEYQDTIGWDETSFGAGAQSWVYLVGVRSNLQQYLYVNGVCVDSVIYNLPFSASDTSYAEKHGYRNTACNFMIGKKVDYSAYFFKGMIDEVRVASIAQSPDWIKLCYMNQKNNDMLTIFQK